MATTHIAVTKTAEKAPDLTSLVTQAWALHQQAEKVKAAMDTMIDASDYTLLETKFGLGAGDGSTVYNLIAGLVAQSNATGTLNDGSWQQLRQRVG